MKSFGMLFRSLICKTLVLFICLSIFATNVHAANIGDVNGDGQADVIDALLTLQYVLYLIPHDAGIDANYLATADVYPPAANQMPEGNNQIDVMDALELLQRVVNLPPPPTPVASFAGVYSGTYSGADSGTITVTLATNGSISGSGISTVDPGNQFTISGLVAAGGNVSLQGTGSAGTATFTGTVTLQGVLAGTWSDGAIGGGTFTTVNTSAVPDFTLTAPSAVTAAQGGAGTATISTTITGGFTAVVALTVSGVPTGATATFSPTSIAVPGSSSATLTITADASTPVGAYGITVTGTGGGKTHTATILLTVTAVPDFTLAAPSAVTAAHGSSTTATISTTGTGGFNASVALTATGLPTGATSSFNPKSIVAPGSGNSTLTLTAGASTPIGTYPVTVTGTGGGKTHTATISFTVTAPPAPKLSLSVTALTFGPQDNFTTSAAQTVTLSNTGNTGILLYASTTWPMFARFPITNDTCVYAPSIFAAGASCTISFAFNPWGDDQLRINYSLQKQLGYNPPPIPPDNYSGVFEVHGDSVTNPQIAVPQRTVQLNGTGVYPPDPDFTLTAPSTVTVAQGGSSTVTVSSSIIGGFNAAVALTKSGAPAGGTATFSPTSIAAPGLGNSTLTLTAGASTPTGTYIITITGTGGGSTHTATISFIVVTPPAASFAGNYSGTYAGDDAGTLTVTLATNGAISGSGNSTLDPTYHFTISGSVAAGGTVSLRGAGNAGTATFTGTITAGVLSGTWSDPVNGLSGTFTTHITATGAVPTVTSMSPSTGAPGTTVTITGTNFTTASSPSASVTFGGGIAASGSNLVLLSATQIVVTVPVGAVTGTITIQQTPGGASGITSSFTVSATGGGVPTVTGMNPSTGTAGTTVTITGTNFSATPANNTVEFNGTLATVTAATTTSLTVSVPRNATTGTVSVNTLGWKGTSEGVFTVTTASSGSLSLSTPFQGVSSFDFAPPSFNHSIYSSNYNDLTWEAPTDSNSFIDLQESLSPHSIFSMVIIYNGGNWLFWGCNYGASCAQMGITFDTATGILILNNVGFQGTNSTPYTYFSGTLHFTPY